MADEAYDSPDSDGHASIPSPTETSFNMSTLQGARHWPPTSSPGPGESSDDEEPLVLYRQHGKKSNRILPRSIDSSPSIVDNATPTLPWKPTMETIDSSPDPEKSPETESVVSGFTEEPVNTMGRKFDRNNALGISNADLAPNKREFLAAALPRILPESPEIDINKRLPPRKETRSVSGVSTGSIMQNENFEELDTNALIEIISRPPRKATAKESGTGEKNGNSNEPESPTKARLTATTNPQTPPNKGIPKRKYDLNGGASGVSIKPNGIASPITSPVLPGSTTPKTGSPSKIFGAKRHFARTLNAQQDDSEDTDSEAPSREVSPTRKGSGKSKANDENTLARGAAATEGTVNSDMLQPPSFKNFSIWALKRSKLARRVSMTSQPTASSQSTTTSEFLRRDPPSPDSDFGQNRSPSLTGHGRSISVQLPAANQIFTDNARNGLFPGTSTFGPSSNQTQTRAPLVERLPEGKFRDRRRSEPHITLSPSSIPPEKQEEPQKQLFTPSNIEKVTEEAPTDGESGSETSGGPVKSGATEIGRGRVVVPDDESDGSEDDSSAVEDGKIHRVSNDGRRMWSGYSQDSQMDGEMSSINSRSLRFDEVEVRVQTPNSVRDDILSSRQDLSCLRPESEPVDTPAPAGKARNFDPSNRILKDFGDKYERGDIAQRSSSAWSSGRGRRNSDLQAQARQYNQQIADLRSKIESLEEAAKEHAEEKEEMAGTINQLHSVLDQKVASTINEPLQRMVKDLERKLADEKKAKADAVAAVEQKYQGIMEEQEAEIGQLQAELDEYANYMPVDNSARTSRIFEDDRDSWVDDKKDISQFFDDTIDNIFTEIRGNAEHDDITEAAEEAETSLRHLAHEAGLGDDLNKASLAAFGIRQLREENTMLKEMYTEREEKVKELSTSQNDMLNKIDDLKSKLDELQGDNADLHAEIDQLEETVENLHQEIEHLQTQLTKKTKELETALNKNDQLVGLEKQISVLKNEITNHHNSYALSQQDLARQRQATAAADARAKESSEALSHLRAELQTSIDNASNLQSEVDAYKSRNTELLRTVESAEKAHKEKLSVLSQDLEDLRKARDTLTKERDAAKAADTLTASLSAKVRSLSEEITATTTTISVLRTEKTTLEANFQKAEAETKAAKSRFNVLLHESTEKETIWNKIKMELQGALEEKTRLLHIAAEPYHNALARIASEVDEVAPDREGDLELFQKIAEILEGEEVAEVDTVANILVGIKAMDETIEDLEQRRKEVEEKNRRLKSAIQKWAGEHQKERQGMEKLRRENKELVLRLKAEKKQSDEKIGQLILALRR